MSSATRNPSGLRRESSGLIASGLRPADTLVMRRESSFVAPEPGLSTRVSGKSVALLAAAAGLAKKAEDVQVIEVAGKVDYTDFLVLMTGTSDRNVAAIAQGVEEELGEHGIRALALEGLPLARWVLIDFVDVVVHVFQSEWREIYDLDGLWMDASRVQLPLGKAPS